MQLAEIVAQAIAQAVGPSQPERAVDVNHEFIKAMVNKGYREIERAATWRFSESEYEANAVEGQREFSLPDDVNLILGVRNVTLRANLDYVDERQGQPDWGVPGNPLTGRVEAYSYWRGQLRLWPVPNKADLLRVQYYRVWPQLAADDDEPIFPETWHSLLVDYATSALILRMPAVNGRYLSESEARPFTESFWRDLERMKASRLTETIGDEVVSHDFEALLAEGHW